MLSQRQTTIKVNEGDLQQIAKKTKKLNITSQSQGYYKANYDIKEPRNLRRLGKMKNENYIKLSKIIKKVILLLLEPILLLLKKRQTKTRINARIGIFLKLSTIITIRRAIISLIILGLREKTSYRPTTSTLVIKSSKASIKLLYYVPYI